MELTGYSSDAAIDLKTGSQTIIMRNDGDSELLVRIERTASRQDAVTAADASAVALFRELFPEQVLSAGQMVSVETITILMVELMAADQLYKDLGDGKAFTQIHQALRFFDATIRQHQGAVVKSVGEGITAVFHQATDALQAAIALVNNSDEALPDADERPRTAIHQGPAMVTTIDDRLDYFGTTVKVAEQLLHSGRNGQIILSSEIAGSPGINDILRQHDNRSLLVDRESLYQYPTIFPHRLLM